ncbi:MAG: HNH endonuclease [Deltaproteobacteria bacterium]|nr:HNH endonuclease [Deltaproteobacteria bacterium]MBW1958045.1 HNH endonuclease [Deltaproteobacteria bacterium]MBW2012633.1 HNH endonuclease [Deltaproteobacteria bacterium]MBW2087474.1 HNH endonuclease [Deltaproteobacteria bacterium]MBW2320330.1 HNH endonuclease [Deltaproteobacteria bacterium]
MHQCVLLNADYTFLNVVNWKRAMCLIAKGKVQVIRQSERLIRTAEGLAVKVPAVMRLIKLIRTLYINRVPFSKKNVLIRDGFKCAYCGGEKRKLTIDHIIPKSRGGKTDFDNCVSSCKSCNNKKGSKIPSEANMYLKVKAYQPTIAEFLRLKVEKLGINKVLKDLGVY